jgi:hypothetical protein
MKVSARLVAIVAISALTLSCGDDDGPTAPAPVENNLVFTRADQSQITFPGAELLVWCGPWEAGEADTLSLKILFAGPNSGWDLRAIVADVTLGQPLSFPNIFVSDQPKDVHIFVLDPPNELSTQEEESSGSITFQQLDCGSGGNVQFSIDAVIGSEVSDDMSVHVTGTFRGPIGTLPQQRQPLSLSRVSD